MNKATNDKYIDIAKRVISIEAESIAQLAKNLSGDFTGAIECILHTSGRVIVCGMGKSGIIGKKLAATLASTGTPSFFMHPGEAYHGDLGMVTSEDIFLAISNSGETDEVCKLIPFLQDNKNKLIALTGSKSSSLAVVADYHLDISVKQEACPLQLAPTSSTTASLVMGDAIAVALMEARDFEPENFARFHPGGSLGKQLLARVGDIMHTNLPISDADDSIKDTVLRVTEGRVGACLVTHQDSIVGIVTDGDIRRAFSLDSMANITAKDIMTHNPITISETARISEAERIMKEKKVTLLCIENNDQKIIGYIQIHDLK